MRRSTGTASVCSGPEAQAGLSRRRLIGLAAGIAVAGAAPGLAAPFVNLGTRAEQVLLNKGARRLYLIRGGQAFATYRVGLGFAPEGHKLRDGDGRTPEGQYWIDRRNPRSEFFLSVGISYPNAADVGRARAMGVDPGGDIFIHGEPVRGRRPPGRDWTAGCIAVSNDEIEEIWTTVPNGVPITILA